MSSSTRANGYIALCMFILGVAAFHARADEADTLRVVTQNLYIGADVQRIVEAQTAEQIPLLVAQTFSIIDGSDFKSRAKSFAMQVKETRPDVIGLQEVALIRYQAQSDYFLGNPQMAVDVRHDFLQDVMEALAEQGLRYKVAGVVNNIDQELPAFGTLDGSNIPTLYDVRLTDRDVILVQERMAVSEVRPYNYISNLIYPSIVGDIAYTRGWIAITARIRDEEYRIVNTHLEVRFNEEIGIIQSLQMQELVDSLATESRATIVMGDLNSDPEHTPDVVYGLPTPYQQLLLAGYADAWSQGGRGTGLSCCRNETLDDFSLPLTERIDYIYSRAALGSHTTALAKRVRAETFSDITKGGLWYSDHEGLLARFRLARAKRDREYHHRADSPHGKERYTQR